MNANNRAAITGDFNRDGRLDLFAGYLNAAKSSFFINASQVEDQAWLQLLLRGTTYGSPSSSPTNYRTTRDAVGARVEIYADLDGDGAIEFNELIADNFTSPLLDPFDESIDVDDEGAERQIREVIAGHSNNGATSDLTVHIGLGLARRAYVTIKWPSGIIQTWPGAEEAYTAVTDVTEIVVVPGMIFDLDPNTPEPNLNQFHVIEELTGSP